MWLEFNPTGESWGQCKRCISKLLQSVGEEVGGAHTPVSPAHSGSLLSGRVSTSGLPIKVVLWAKERREAQQCWWCVPMCLQRTGASRLRLYIDILATLSHGKSKWETEWDASQCHAKWKFATNLSYLYRRLNNFFQTCIAHCKTKIEFMPFSL